MHIRPDHLDIYKKCHDDLKDKTNGEAHRAARLSVWATKKYVLVTTTVCKDFESLEVCRETSPCKHRYSDLPLESIPGDTQLLLKAVQVTNATDSNVIR